MMCNYHPDRSLQGAIAISSIGKLNQTHSSLEGQQARDFGEYGAHLCHSWYIESIDLSQIVSCDTIRT